MVKRERKWHIRSGGDQLAVFPFCVLYVSYMCQEKGIKERGEIKKEKKTCKECQRHIVTTSTLLQLIEKDLCSLFSSQCSFMAVFWKKKKKCYTVLL